MILSRLHLHHFRTYRDRAFLFSPKTTVIVGPNAIGKTNLLESIYCLSMGKSFRAELDREMIQYSQDLARTAGLVKDQVDSNDEEKLEVMITRGVVQGEKAPLKKYLQNGVAKRMIDYVGVFRSVIFWPQDLELITHSPSYRRNYLDSVLLQIDREYRRTLSSYERGVRSRNKILERIREREAQRRELVFWDQLLINQGNYITQKREEFIRFINDKKILIDEHLLEVMYDKSTISPERLLQYKEEEVLAGKTLVGPHRDDFRVQLKHETLGNRNLRVYGSRGEQRLAVLFLKLSERSYIEKQTGVKPILLLDDIFSELDHNHREYIMDLVPKQQTIMTSADRHLIDGSVEYDEVIDLEKS